MAVTSGFFNSLNRDRRYNAEQMSAIFNGIINDGVFANIGTSFTVVADSGTTVHVGIGRAWFNSTWLYNDTILPVTLDASELVLDRIDAVVIEIDRSDAVRAGSIKVVKGTPASTPQNPTMTSTNYVHQYPLAYILRKAGSTEITQANITSMIGTSSCPYITGILQVQSIDNIVAQWQAQWLEWYNTETAQGEADVESMINQWNTWFNTQTTQGEANLEQWMLQMASDFNEWFGDLQIILDGDVATGLASQILEIQETLETLAKENCIYVPLEDSSGNPIQDNLGNDIEGKSVLGGGAGTSEEVTQLKGEVEGLKGDLSQTNNTLEEHIDDTTVHITEAERTSWNGKADQTDLDVVEETADGALQRSGGTMTGALVAGGTQDVATSQARNIYDGTTDMEVGVTTLATGVIYLMYE